MKKHTFIFSCTDNGGGHQSFEVRATDKQEAIEICQEICLWRHLRELGV